MAEKKRQGDIGEAMIIAEATKRGYQVAIPLGEDWRYDLIVLRKNRLERVQCKYTKSDGSMLVVRCRSSNNWNQIHYTSKDIDWIAVYDETTQQSYFVPSKMLGKGRSAINLRLKPTKNNQEKYIRWAKDYIKW